MAKKILLADDSITIQKVVELTFSDGDYEVVAVNNGAKAIQKLSEMRPDIILSDIIMPEKNGYEVCEFVKSRPEFRGIPVVLLTGTFEPFDPDRADKAGCDAVVTKPFESQSLIHKVDELIRQSAEASAAAAPAAPRAPEPPAFDQKPALAGTPPIATPPVAAPFPEHGGDVFGAAQPQTSSPAEMPFETPPAEAFSGETRAFTRMSFEDLQRAAPQPPAPPAPPPPAAPETSPWDEAPPIAAETRAFPPMSFEDPQRPAAPPVPPAPAEDSPWDEQPAFSGETRAVPKISFEDLQRAAAAPAPAPAAPPPPPAAAESSPWEEQPPAFGGETPALPPVTFEDLQQAAPPPPPATPEPPPPAEPSPWEEQPPAFGGETRTFPRMRFDDLQQVATSTPPPPPEAPRAGSSLWDEPAPAAAPSWSPAEEPSAAVEPLAEPAQHDESQHDESPFGIGAPEADAVPEPAWSPKAEEPELSAAGDTAAAAPAIGGSGDLTDEQIERIAHRVVQLLSTEVIKNIAWEVIPDMAEMIVRERVRQLESES